MTEHEHEFEDVEFVTFETTTKDGETVEMAVVEEFEFEKKIYAACARVVNDEIDMDGLYIYKIIGEDDNFTAEKITDEEEYTKVSQAYLELED